MDISDRKNQRGKKAEIFCCYARKDQSLLLELKIHLAALQREGLITLWADIDINAGTEWKKEIHRHLNTASIILLLVSPDFIASDYCYSVEMQRAVERHKLGEACVLPIILRPSLWQRTPLGEFQALPPDANPITKWPDQDDAFCHVVEGIRNVVEVYLAKQTHLAQEDSALNTKEQQSRTITQTLLPVAPPRADPPQHSIGVPDVPSNAQPISPATKTAQARTPRPGSKQPILPAQQGLQNYPGQPNRLTHSHSNPPNPIQRKRMPDSQGQANSRGNLQRLALFGLAGLIVVVLVSGIIWFNYFASAGANTHGFSTLSLSNPSEITFSNGALWFTEFSGDAIGRITLSGSITEYPTHTASSNPSGITAGRDGTSWFTMGAYGNSYIGHITPNGSITKFPISNSADEITMGPDGNLWFTEGGGDAIGRMTPRGSVTEFSIPNPTGNYLAHGITVGPDGNLWFTEYSGNRIGRITPSGSITEFYTPTENSLPVGITTGPDGNLWFTEADGNKIGQITPSGSITEFPIHTASSNPGGITVGSDGNLWFTEYSGNKIGRITPSGSITEFPIHTNNSKPRGITAGSDGNLWFTEYSGNKIGRITPSGSITEFPTSTT